MQWDSPDLLAKLRRALRRPTIDPQSTDVDLYALLTDAQEYWYSRLAAHVPQALLTPPTLLTTADGGETYTFGVNAATGEPVTPRGHVVLRESASGRPIYPGAEWMDDRFILEGSKIRWGNGRKRLFSAGPIARWVPEPAAISAASPPSLQPPHGRVLIVDKAAAEWSRAGGLRDPQPYLDKAADEWNRILTELRTQYHGIGAEGVGEEDARWWNGIDTGEDYVRHD